MIELRTERLEIINVNEKFPWSIISLTEEKVPLKLSKFSFPLILLQFAPHVSNRS